MNCRLLNRPVWMFSNRGSLRFLATFTLLWLTCPLSLAQQISKSVDVQVHFEQPERPVASIWNFFGYDEPNYTYAPNGKKLLGELAALGPAPVYIRVHNLLTTGDGSS